LSSAFADSSLEAGPTFLVVVLVVVLVVY
jgi:hypothetical protein